MTGLPSWLVRETERNPRHSHVSLFVGSDADHRALAGTLVLNHDQADDLFTFVEGRPKRKRVEVERAVPGVRDARTFVEGYAAEHGLRVEWEGEIGFGRECVGLFDGDRDVYVAWTGGAGPPPETPRAYHKDDYIAVLGRGPEAEEQLAAWVAQLAARGARFERRPKQVPDLAALVYGFADELTAVVDDA